MIPLVENPTSYPIPRQEVKTQALAGMGMDVGQAEPTFAYHLSPLYKMEMVMPIPWKHGTRWEWPCS